MADKPAWKPYTSHEGPWPKAENPPTDPEAQRKAQAKTMKMLLRVLWESCRELGIDWKQITDEVSKS